MPIQRDAEQIDALSEIFNIGVGKAAAAMGRLLRDEVLLSVPHVSVFTVNEAAQQLGTQGHPMYGVRQPFRGVLNGDALLIFPGHRSLEIVRIVAGWPHRFEAKRSTALGFVAESSFDEIIRVHIDDELHGTFVK